MSKTTKSRNDEVSQQLPRGWFDAAHNMSIEDRERWLGTVLGEMSDELESRCGGREAAYEQIKKIALDMLDFANRQHGNDDEQAVILAVYEIFVTMSAAYCAARPAGWPPPVAVLPEPTMVQ